MANRVSSRRLVGRDHELDLLLGLVRRAGEGDGGAAVVVGEAGIGKSRLVSEFARRARECGTLVLVGECVDLAEAELPYAPIVGALRAVVRERSEPDLAKLFGAARSELARLLPELGDPGPDVQGSVGQTRLFELLLGVLSRLGQERPVALVIEDVHWADSASLDLLAFLVRNQRSERLATVITFRSGELSPEHPVRARVAELEHGGRAQRIELDPLSPEHVAEQVLDITGTPPTAELSHALHARAGGNPFFVEELLAAGDGDELPDSLRDALLLRLRRLSERAREIVGVAAVAGRTIDRPAGADQRWSPLRVPARASAGGRLCRSRRRPAHPNSRGARREALPGADARGLRPRWPPRLPTTGLRPGRLRRRWRPRCGRCGRPSGCMPSRRRAGSTRGCSSCGIGWPSPSASRACRALCS